MLPLATARTEERVYLAGLDALGADGGHGARRPHGLAQRLVGQRVGRGHRRDHWPRRAGRRATTWPAGARPAAPLTRRSRTVPAAPPPQGLGPVKGAPACRRHPALRLPPAQQGAGELRGPGAAAAQAVVGDDAPVVGGRAEQQVVGLGPPDPQAHVADGAAAPTISMAWRVTSAWHSPMAALADEAACPRTLVALGHGAHRLVDGGARPARWPRACRPGRARWPGPPPRCRGRRRATCRTAPARPARRGKADGGLVEGSAQRLAGVGVEGAEHAGVRHPHAVELDVGQRAGGVEAGRALEGQFVGRHHELAERAGSRRAAPPR